MSDSKKISIIILGSLITTLLVLFFIYSFLPIYSINSLTGNGMVGSTITTINASDTIKNSRTTINDNFTSLNNGKIEISTTSLPLVTSMANLSTVGTITSGTWHGSTLTVGYGGTGSTTLMQYGVLLGNGTGNIGVVSGLGSSGQFLTSNGPGAAPSWQTSSVNLGSDYTWTGHHNFTATSSFTANTAFSSLSIGGTSTASLVGGATTTLHYHYATMGSFSKTMTDGSGTGTTTITHGLGITPNKIYVKCRNAQSSASTNGAFSDGTYMNGAGQSLYIDITDNYQTTNVQGYLIFMYGNASDAGYQYSSSVVLTSTTITIGWTKSASPQGTAVCTWEAYQ